MERIEHPWWPNYSKLVLDDGKYNIGPRPRNTLAFPGYIENSQYPFTYCNALTMEVGGRWSNEWSGTDNPVRFADRLKEQGPDWPYRTKKIVYKTNSNGYRTALEWKDVDWANSIVVIGDSITYGIGLADDETICYHLERLTGRHVVNLGYPSGSNQLMLNNAAVLAEKFPTPWGVVMNWSSPERFRYYSAEGYHEIGIWNSPPDEYIVDGVNLSNLHRDMYFDRTNELAINYYIGLAASAIWRKRTRYATISFFENAARYTRADAFFRIDNQARDGYHPGPVNCLQAATFLADKLQKNG